MSTIRRPLQRTGFISLVTSLAALLACGCGGGDTTAVSFLSDSRVLVQGVDVTNKDCRTGICQHNENTDLTTYKGAIYLVHRTAISQILGPNSALHIYKTSDGGAHFTEQAIIPAPLMGQTGRDLRDPHFYQVGDTLHIKALTRLPVTSFRDSGVDTIAVGTSSTDGVHWTPLLPIGPTGFSFWRIQSFGGVFYSAAYADGDMSVTLFSSTDGTTWTRGADVYTVSADTPLETELTFMPSGRLLALVRMDGNNDELLGDQGRLRTKICWSMPPYDKFDCPQEFLGQRLDGPLSIPWKGRLFHIARKHLPPEDRKRTALFEITGNLEGGPLAIKEWGELPSAGDTSYAGAAALDGNRFLATWYSGELAADEKWVFGMLHATDIRQATIDLSQLH